MQNINILKELRSLLDDWAKELGFQQLGVSDLDISDQTAHFKEWLGNSYHGDMKWIEEHAELRLNPKQLHEGVARVISVRMDYLPENTEQIKILKSSEKAYISRYALGRDYHKLIRKRLATLAKRIEDYCVKNAIEISPNQRPFVDSAPVLERPFAKKAGLGWVGKHTLIINPQVGSWFFLGEIYTNIPLPVNAYIETDRCGECSACMQVCPTDAFPQPYVLDARRCISYLTIENKGTIAEEFREVMGNRVFGCDDCQAICPWNKYAKHTQESAFTPRHQLENSDLLALFKWDEATFLEKTAGSPIRRIGYQLWLRNLSVGLGNAAQSPEIIQALENRKSQGVDALVEEHINWALHKQQNPTKRRVRKLKNQK